MRSLTSSQRAALAADIEPMLAEEAKKRQRAAGGDAASKALKKGDAKPQPKPPEPKPATPQHKAAQPVHSSSRVVEVVPQPVATPEANKAREQAAKLTGTNSKYVSDAKAVKEKAPDLFEKVKNGEITLPQAKQRVKSNDDRCVFRIGTLRNR